MAVYSVICLLHLQLRQGAVAVALAVTMGSTVAAQHRVLLAGVLSKYS